MARPAVLGLDVYKRQLQGSLHNVVHLGNGDLAHLHLLCLLLYELADKIDLRPGKCDHGPVGGLIDGHHHLLYIKMCIRDSP